MGLMHPTPVTTTRRLISNRPYFREITLVSIACRRNDRLTAKVAQHRLFGFQQMFWDFQPMAIGVYGDVVQAKNA